MLTILLVSASCSAVGDMIAIATNRSQWRYFFKTSTLLILISIVILNMSEPTSYHWFILFALIFSMMGDVLLLLPSRFFISGICAFLLAHISYVIAFPATEIRPWMQFLLGLILALIAFSYYRQLKQGVKREGGKKLQFAVMLYIFVISLMVYRGILSGEALVVIGSILFYLSDGMLSWRRFIYKHPVLNYCVILSYYLAQAMFALSVV